MLSEISARLENIKNIAARSYDTEWGNRSSISRNPRLRPLLLGFRLNLLTCCARIQDMQASLTRNMELGRRRKSFKGVNHGKHL